ncbi:MAG: hypothetical protein V3T49_09645 [Dehalococcoidia bacterium]
MRNPSTFIVSGFSAMMPSFRIDDNEILALIEYLKTLLMVGFEHRSPAP